MSIRNLLALYITLLVTSLGVGSIGMLIGYHGLMYAGTLGSIAAATGLVCCTLRRTAEITTEERAAEQETGYHLALHHVALGLLDPTPYRGTVVPLRPEFSWQQDRKVQ